MSGTGESVNRINTTYVMKCNEDILIRKTQKL